MPMYTHYLTMCIVGLIVLCVCYSNKTQVSQVQWDKTDQTKSKHILAVCRPHPDGQRKRERCYMSLRSMVAIVSSHPPHPSSGRGITPFHALKLWPLQCAKGAHGYGLPRVPDAIGAIDRANAGLRRKARAWEREWGRRREMGREKERECCRNVSPGSLSWAGAGLQECSPGDPSEG